MKRPHACYVQHVVGVGDGSIVRGRRYVKERERQTIVRATGSQYTIDYVGKLNVTVRGITYDMDGES